VKKALLWTPLPEKAVQCQLCAHRCIIKNGEMGICHVRENISGTLFSHTYNKLIAAHIDPIEKKPLFHFLPGSLSYSVATPGCNFTCLHCQNASISQMPRELGVIKGESVSPDNIVKNALSHHCKSVSYTYTEPTIFFEYAYETAVIAREKGIKNVFVTNGFMTSEAIEKLAPVLDAANIDLKAFSDTFYKKICGGRLNPVKQTIMKMVEKGIWVEITTLIIPGYNDSESELKKIADFIAGINSEIPWHVSAFFPTYRLKNTPPTPTRILIKTRKTGLACGLKFVYTGNVPDNDSESTACPECGRLLVRRKGYSISDNVIKTGRCPYCQAKIRGLWS